MASHARERHRRAADRPEVSILVNAYNGERYLGEALDSVLAQTFGDWELVFWDNQSTDGTADIVRAADDARIRYHYAPSHTHLGAARRAAQGLLRGRWIAILDVDDLWRPDKLRKQLAAAAAMPGAGFVYAQVAVRDESGGDAARDHVFSRMAGQELPSGNLYPRLLRGNFISVPSLLLDAGAFFEVGGFSGRYPVMEDYRITLNIARRYPVAVVNEPLCEYRIHGGNRSAGGAIDNFEDLAILRELLPDRRAAMAMPRVVARHFLHCARERRWPRFGGLLGAMARPS